MSQPVLHFEERSYPFEKANNATIQSMISSLLTIRESISPFLERISANESWAKYGAFRGRMTESLTHNDFLVLSTAQRASILEKPFSYTDVQDLVWEMNGKTMNTQSIYNSLTRLSNNNLIIELSVDVSNENASQLFSITRYGAMVMSINLVHEEVRNEAILAK